METCGWQRYGGQGERVSTRRTMICNMLGIVCGISAGMVPYFQSMMNERHIQEELKVTTIPLSPSAITTFNSFHKRILALAERSVPILGQ